MKEKFMWKTEALPFLDYHSENIYIIVTCYNNLFTEDNERKFACFLYSLYSIFNLCKQAPVKRRRLSQYTTPKKELKTFTPYIKTWQLAWDFSFFDLLLC